MYAIDLINGHDIRSNDAITKRLIRSNRQPLSKLNPGIPLPRICFPDDGCTGDLSGKIHSCKITFGHQNEIACDGNATLNAEAELITHLDAGWQVCRKLQDSVGVGDHTCASRRVIHKYRSTGATSRLILDKAAVCNGDLGSVDGRHLPRRRDNIYGGTHNRHRDSGNGRCSAGDLCTHTVGGRSNASHRGLPTGNLRPHSVHRRTSTDHRRFGACNLRADTIYG